MKIRARINGELMRPAHWRHNAGDEREFAEQVAKHILTSDNYEKVTVRKESPKKKKIEVEDND